jgi:hypothetical protein
MTPIEIITTIVGAIAAPYIFYFFHKYYMDSLQSIDPKKLKGIIFFFSIPGGIAGWFIGKGLDYLWKLIFG